MQKQKNNIKIIIITVAGLAVITAGIIIGYQFSKKSTTIDTSPNVTVLKCNIGKTLNDSDLKDIEELAKGVVGNKFKKAEINPGMVSISGLPTDESGEEIKFDIGDSVAITCLLLTEDERLDIFTAIANKYNFIHHYGYDAEQAMYQFSFADVYKPEYK